MAKLHAQIENIGFEEAVNNITGSTLGKSLSSSLEETFDEVFGETKCSIRTIERYTLMGDNRVSMTIVFVQSGNDPIHIMATSTGGGNGPLKVFAWGEASFLGTLKNTLEESYGDYLVGNMQIEDEAWK